MIRLKSVAFTTEAGIGTNLGLLQREDALIFGLDGCDRHGLMSLCKHSIFVCFQSFLGVIHPEPFGRCFESVGFCHLDGIDLVCDPNPLLQMLIGFILKLHLADGHVRYVVVVSLRLLEVEFEIQIRRLEILENVVGGDIEDQGVCIGIQQIYAICIERFELVVVKAGHLGLGIVEDGHPHINGFIELDEFKICCGAVHGPNSR
jgi:hypothetical protein